MKNDPYPASAAVLRGLTGDLAAGAGLEGSGHDQARASDRPIRGPDDVEA